MTLHHLLNKTVWFKCICLLCWAVTVTTPVIAQQDIRIGVVTFGPGQNITSRFGHTSLMLLHGNGYKEFYELAAGVKENRILPWYLDPGGPMQYVAQPVQRATALNKYVMENRSIDVRMLNFDPEQRQLFALLLAQAISKENAQYDAELYDRNCTTQVRDMINLALGGALTKQFAPLPAEQPLRNQTLRGLTHSTPLMMGVDLVLGRASDRPVNHLEETVLPIELAMLLDRATTTDSNGNTIPLVAEHQQIYHGTFTPIPDAPPNLTIQLWLLGAMLATIVFLFSQRQAYQPAVTPIIRYWAVTQGLIGFVIFYFWFIGSEPLCDWNENILLFSPVGLAFIRIKHPAMMNQIIWLMCFSVGLSLLAKLLPGAQHNWGWTGLVLPAHLVALYRTISSSVSSQSGQTERARLYLQH